MNSKQNNTLFISLLGVIGVLLFIIIIFLTLFLRSEKTQENTQSEILFPGYSQMMYDHCLMMPEMTGCEPYNILAQKKGETISQDQNSDSKTSFSDTDISSLPQAQASQIISLKDGDEYTLEVTQVVKEIGNTNVAMLAYNGQIPGPTITAPAGSHVTIHFVNKVKDLQTTLHSHGLRGDYTMDGVPKDMMGYQDPVSYGKSFDYELEFPDTGVFWYHPHIREDMQQELGLYGNYIVEPTQEDFYNSVNEEKTLVLDDILIENGAVAPIPKNYANYALMGRYGNTMMINGDTNYVLDAKKGETMRLYLTNVSNTRVYNFQIPGIQMKLVGGDIGKYEKETFVNSVIIAPAERYIVEVYFPDSGDFEIKNINPESQYTLGKIQVSDDEISPNYANEFQVLRTNQDVISDIDTYRKYFSKNPDKTLLLDMTMGGMSMNMGMGGMGMMGTSQKDSHGGIEWEDSMNAMNIRSTTENTQWHLIDEQTQKQDMDINWEFQKGDVVKVRIKNPDTGMHPMQHPIHFHGQRFLVLNNNGEENTNLVWKDTVLIPAGEYVDILIDMSNPGEWMAHCHIAEHLSAGMMMHFSVKE